MPADRVGGGGAQDVGDAGEFELIAAMRHRWGDLAAGIGDDAAQLRVPRGEIMVASTDAAVEGIHFRRDWLTLRECGYRAVTGALSDLAAMGAAPLGVLVAIQLPASDRGVLLDLADGIGDAARAAGTVIVGGNLSAGDALGVTTSALGSAFAPLSRAGARAGDRLYVTGALGGPAAALRTLLSGGAPAPALRERLAAPAARIAEARWLAANGATAAIDISDGLAADARHLARASGVVVEIDAGSVPVFDGATPDDALAGGEEYELLVAAPAAPAAPAFDEDAFRRRFGVMLTPVGRIASGVSDVRLLEAGKRVAAPPGHDHFSR